MLCDLGKPPNLSGFRFFTGQPEGWIGGFCRPVGRAVSQGSFGEYVGRVRAGSRGEVWVEPGFEKGGCGPQVIFQGTLETGRPLLPRSSGWLIACLSRAALPSGSSGFSPKSVIVGMCETQRAGGWPRCE